MEKTYIIAIEGMAASGKTTLANKISQSCDCNVFHMDEFFLPPHLKTSARLSQIGGNIHYERLLAEIVEPLRRGTAFSYNAYSCKTGEHTKVSVEPKSIAIIEGSYSSHPSIFEFVQRLYFLQTTKEKQVQRIIARGQEQLLDKFLNEWIPMENQYFAHHQIRSKAYEIVYT